MKILNHYIFKEYSKLIKTGFLWITGPKDLATCRKGEISRQIRIAYALVLRIADVVSGARVDVVNLDYLNVRPATWSKYRFSAPIRHTDKHLGAIL
jgi:hypothetical protein